jgi:hypothetical protein
MFVFEKFQLAEQPKINIVGFNRKYTYTSRKSLEIDGFEKIWRDCFDSVID